MIKMEYLTEATEAPEGKSLITCDVCKRSFAVPAGSELLIGERICEECKAAKDAAEAAVDLKTNSSDELKKALGE